jgi:hypothetical protein
LVTDVLVQHIGQAVQEKDSSWTALKNGPIFCPKMSVTNQEPKLHNNQIEKSSTTLSENLLEHYKITVKRKGLKIFGHLIFTKGNI